MTIYLLLFVKKSPSPHNAAAPPAAAAAPPPAAAAPPPPPPAAAAAAPLPPPPPPAAAAAASSDDDDAPEDLPRPPLRRQMITDPPERLQHGNHVPTQIPNNLQRICRVCAANKIRKDSRFMCAQCQVALCVHHSRDCFNIYHTQARYWDPPGQATPGRGRPRPRVGQQQ